jgi:predicted nuclease of predicted toxin-antitoxin system
MKFLVDMPLSPGLARWLVESGHDAVHAADLGLEAAPDSVIVERARDEQRVILTADLDYPRMLALTHSPGPGLILFRGGNFAEPESRRRLARVLEVIPPAELSHSLVVVEKDRIRRRRLPLELGS